ncbi:hypothetical protein [Actinacidiphila bryophytorum]|uniref:hypothetical protein n=1 Tax=Actinacidiphila bryophytorum TaxID=1436133 RepID=UPI002176B637|nr:hypothetical protein [Actinacidiphila bryophytorum]UWE13227.1 hypothetical protein NYE86_34185 [Actinacidiphila bryophytorum]
MVGGTRPTTTAPAATAPATTTNAKPLTQAELWNAVVADKDLPDQGDAVHTTPAVIAPQLIPAQVTKLATATHTSS